MIDKMNNREIDGLNNDIFRDGIKGGVIEEKQGKDNQPKNNLRKGVAIGLGTLTVLTTAAGCTPVPSESAMPTKEPNETQPGTESPSQTNIQETPTATITFSPTGEVTVSPKPSQTPEVTVKPTEKPTDNPTVEPTETIDPNETEQNPPPTEAPTATVTPEATPVPLSEYNLRLLEIYGPELEAEDCKQELLLVCSKFLNTLDINNSYAGEFYVKNVKLTRDQIFSYGKEGKTTIDTFVVKNFKDGGSALAYVDCDPDVVKYADQATANWEEDVPEFLKSIVANGMCVFYQGKIFPKKGMDSYYDGNGLFILNCNNADKKRLGAKQMIFTIQKHLGVESFGIKSLNLGGGFAIPNNSGYIKQELFEVFCKYMYIKTGKKIYNDFAIGAAAHKKDFIDKSQPQAELAQQAMDENLITSLSGQPWSEILAVVNGN